MRFQHTDDAVAPGEGTFPDDALLSRLISGGQAGAERAVLEWAIENHVEHGGSCPHGRRAEDGVIPARFELRETRTRNYAEALERNIHESDATLILTVARKLSGSLKRTYETAKRAHRPVLHLSKTAPVVENARQLQEFIREESVCKLHVTGTRLSEEPEINGFVSALMSEFAASAAATRR